MPAGEQATGEQVTGETPKADNRESKLEIRSAKDTLGIWRDNWGIKGSKKR